MTDLNKKIEKILRGQFVDRAYRKDGTTSWGIYETQDEILSTIYKHLEKKLPKKAKYGKSPGWGDAVKSRNIALSEIKQLLKEELLK